MARSAKAHGLSDFLEFIEKDMRMSHIYQPLLIRMLLESGGASTLRDLAVIEGNFSGIPALSLSPKEPSVGDAIWVAGAPKGLQGTLSTGIVSAFRDASYLGFKSYQINAAISPGSSGGPVMNENGEIVGVSVASFTEGQALNFAIPSYYVEELLNP